MVVATSAPVRLNTLAFPRGFTRSPRPSSIRHAPKSNSVGAYFEAGKMIEEQGDQPFPSIL